MIKPGNPDISITRQCELAKVNRSSYYYRSKPVSVKNLVLMRRIDELYTKYPYYGSPRMTAQLNREGYQVNHKRIERLMRIMGIQAIFPRKNTSRAGINHDLYPYLLNGVNIKSPNQVWGTDITYVRAADSWFYLVVMLDWYSRYVINWQMSSSLSVDFCLQNLRGALQQAEPQIHNSDQGSQFTSAEYLDLLRNHRGVLISMDGRGRCFDNIFNERFWRTLKYEEVYLHDYQSLNEARDSLFEYFQVYNYERLHSALGYQTPAEVYFQSNHPKSSFPCA